MKKSLIALAALAAVGGASAQSSVTLYGNIDAGYGSHTTKSRDGTVFTKTRGVMDGAWAGSRIGFRGTEDLGGGLRASFTMEQGISVASPDGFNIRMGGAGHQIPGIQGASYTPNNNRQTWLGLGGGFGEVRIGYQYTNSYDLVAFQGYNWAEYQGHNYQNAAHANGTRANMITYIAPNLSGFTLKAQYGSGTGREKVESNAATTTGYARNNNQYMSLMALYAAGPLSAGYVYSRSNIEQAGPVGVTTSSFNVASAAAPALPTNTTERDAVAHHIAGSWDFGVAKVALTHGRLTSDGSATSTADTRTKATQLTLQAPIGAFSLLGAYGRATVQTTGAAQTTDSKGYTVGVSYALSKRTNVYAFYGSEKNDAVATAATAGYKDQKSIIGVRHTF